MSKKKVLLRGVFINRDTNGEGVLKVGTTLIRVSTVMGILYMSCLIQNVKLVERYVGRMSDRVSGNCYNVNSNRLLNMMKQMDKEILNNENMLEEKYDMISSIMYKRQILKYELRRLG